MNETTTNTGDVLLPAPGEGKQWVLVDVGFRADMTRLIVAMKRNTSATQAELAGLRDEYLSERDYWKARAQRAEGETITAEGECDSLRVTLAATRAELSECLARMADASRMTPRKDAV